MGFADLVIAGTFVIKGICIRAGKADPSSPFLSFPAKRGTGDAQDRYFDIAFPITAEAYQQAKVLILEKYRRPLRIDNPEIIRGTESTHCCSIGKTVGEFAAAHTRPLGP